MCCSRISRRVIEGATRLKAIVKYGVGIDAIDIDAAREHGVPVVNVPAYAGETVAEGAFALLMALFKRFKPIPHAMHTAGWVRPEPRRLADDLSGKTPGLVGCGRIGRCMARMAGAFRMRVLAYDHEGVLLHALTERRIAGAGLDVFGQEPLSRQGHSLSALCEMDNVMQRGPNLGARHSRVGHPAKLCNGEWALSGTPPRRGRDSYLHKL
jgi:phosphoglycerate dehydrogenase-like enzyme